MAFSALNISTAIKKTIKADFLAKEELEAVRSFRYNTIWATDGLGSFGGNYGSSYPRYLTLDNSVSPPKWKSDATGGGIIIGDVIISETQSMGPTKITGNLTLNNNSVLNVTGTIYVIGNIFLGNGSTIKLDSSYSTLGGIVLADGTINTGNGNIFSGSGQAGSYLLLLSTSTSDSAITVSNNSNGAVFYTSTGGLRIANNVSVVEATGYKVIMLNNSTIQYSSGIVNIYFSNGPGGGWKVTSWTEQ